MKYSYFVANSVNKNKSKISPRKNKSGRGANYSVAVLEMN